MNKKFKFLGAAALAVALSFGAVNGDVDAMSRADMQKIKVSADGSNFQYWSDNSPVKKALIAYVKDVTDPMSKKLHPCC